MASGYQTGGRGPISRGSRDQYNLKVHLGDIYIYIYISSKYISQGSLGVVNEMENC